MPRNRVIYQNEGLFVGPEVGDIAGSLEYVQSIDYDFSIPKEGAGILGKASSIDKYAAGVPTASLTINYIPNSFENEELIKLDVSKNILDWPVTSGISSETNRHKDKRNIYLATAKDGKDLNGLSIDDVSGVLSFHTCRLESYSFSAGVGSLPQGSMSFTADDANYFISGQDLDMPILNRRTRDVTGSFNITLPKDGSDKVIMSSEGDITLPENISISITDSTEDTTLVDIKNDSVQNFSVNFSLPRSPVTYVGHKMNIDNLIAYPTEVSSSIELIANEGQISGFNDFIKDDPRYKISVDIKKAGGTKKMRYTLKNATIDEISYGMSVGDTRKTVNLQLSTELDPLDTNQGLFLSGTL